MVQSPVEFCISTLMFSVPQEDCPCCSQVPQQLHFAEHDTLQDVIDFLVGSAI